MTKIGIIRAKVWKFGDNISTTDITPGEMFMGHRLEPKDIAFAAIRPDWREQVQPGDCIVAGKNFGFGSHRASANDVMKDLKLGCIVADSIARIYYRSGIAIGFPAFVCPGVSNLFEEGQELELDIYNGTVKNLTSGEILTGRPYPPQLLEILDSGGIMPRLVEQAKKSNN